MSSTSSVPGSSSIARATAYRPPYTRSASNTSSSENLPPRSLARLAREVRDLQKSPPEGIRLVVDDDSGLPSNLGELMAEVEGPQGTPYETKYFLLKLVFSPDFPASPPRGFFLTKIYHPNVDMSTGAICVNTLKKDWTADTTLSHVLAVIRCLLIVPFPESSLNDEAGKLFMESYDEYSKRARLLADVHGRTLSLAKKEEQEGCDSCNDEETNNNGDEKKSAASAAREGRVLKSSSDNPLRNNNTAAPSIGGSSKKLVQVATVSSAAKKITTKKKSLKRL